MHLCLFDYVTAEKNIQIASESLVSGQFVSKCMCLNNLCGQILKEPKLKKKYI